MNERIKELRKNLNLTQKSFGDSIDLSESSISKIEKGTTIVTDRVINSICDKFDVNEDWLRTGSGEMFNRHEHDEEIREYLKDVSEGKAPILEDIMRVYFSLPADAQRAFNDFVVKLSKEVSRNPQPIAGQSSAEGDTRNLTEEDLKEIDRMVEGYRRELISERSIPEEYTA